MGIRIPRFQFSLAFILVLVFVWAVALAFWRDSPTAVAAAVLICQSLIVFTGLVDWFGYERNQARWDPPGFRWFYRLVRSMALVGLAAQVALIESLSTVFGPVDSGSFWLASFREVDGLLWLFITVVCGTQPLAWSCYRAESFGQRLGQRVLLIGGTVLILLRTFDSLIVALIWLAVRGIRDGALTPVAPFEDVTGMFTKFEAFLRYDESRQDLWMAAVILAALVVYIRGGRIQWLSDLATGVLVVGVYYALGSLWLAWQQIDFLAEDIGPVVSHAWGGGSISLLLIGGLAAGYLSYLRIPPPEAPHQAVPMERRPDSTWALWAGSALLGAFVLEFYFQHSPFGFFGVVRRRGPIPDSMQILIYFAILAILCLVQAWDGVRGGGPVRGLVSLGIGLFGLGLGLVLIGNSIPILWTGKSNLPFRWVRLGNGAIAWAALLSSIGIAVGLFIHLWKVPLPGTAERKWRQTFWLIFSLIVLIAIHATLYLSGQPTAMRPLLRLLVVPVELLAFTLINEPLLAAFFWLILVWHFGSASVDLPGRQGDRLTFYQFRMSRFIFLVICLPILILFCGLVWNRTSSLVTMIQFGIL